MKTKFNTLMISRFHLAEMEHLPTKKYKAVMSALLHYFYDEVTPDFSRFSKSDELDSLFERMVKFIEVGLTKVG